MAYMIHITRNPEWDEDGPAITLAEWQSAVAAMDGVRLAEGDYSVRLPETGQTFVLRNNGGDADLHHPHVNEWRRTFRFDAESIQFRGPEDFDNPANHLRQVACRLAAALGAVVCGDDGEIYD
jgi:hypothetical protein